MVELVFLETVLEHLKSLEDKLADKMRDVTYQKWLFDCELTLLKLGNRLNLTLLIL